MVTYLGSLVQSCCGEEEHCKQISLACVGSARSIWSTLGLPQLMAVCVFLVYIAHAPGCSAGVLSKVVLRFVYFPGLSCSGSGSQVLHKGAELVRPAFCALPRSDQLRRPGAWPAQSPPSWGCILSPPLSQLLSVLCVSSGELISGCNPPSGCLLSRIPRSLG